MAQADDPNDVISSIYKSMSQIIEALNTDNVLLNKQVEKIRNELEYVHTTITSLKSDTETISTVCTIRNSDLMELKNKINIIGDLQKHVMDTRNMLIQTLDTNIKAIRKELADLHDTRDYVKSLVEEEIDHRMVAIQLMIDHRINSIDYISGLIHAGPESATDTLKMKEKIEEYLNILNKRIADYSGASGAS
jgi:prefoldin subunit 5